MTPLHQKILEACESTTCPSCFDDYKYNLAVIGTLLDANAAMERVLETSLNYLNWNADNLSGDDLIGDGKLTSKYRRQLSEINEALLANHKRMREIVE